MRHLRRWFEGGAARYRSGLGISARSNAGAFAFSIVITSSYGMVNAFDRTPNGGDIILFGLGGVIAFALAGLLSSFVSGEEEEPRRVQVRVIASALSVFSVLTSIGATRLVVWAAGGWEAWFFSPMAGILTFLFLNGLEYALAEQEDEEQESEP